MSNQLDSKALKETYAHFYNTVCRSLRCAQNVSVKFQLKNPTDHLLYQFENDYFEWKQKHAVFVSL